jgi:hypothetical protein
MNALSWTTRPVALAPFPSPSSSTLLLRPRSPLTPAALAPSPLLPRAPRPLAAPLRSSAWDDLPSDEQIRNSPYFNSEVVQNDFKQIMQV